MVAMNFTKISEPDFWNKYLYFISNLLYCSEDIPLLVRTFENPVKKFFSWFGKILRKSIFHRGKNWHFFGPQNGYLWFKFSYMTFANSITAITNTPIVFYTLYFASMEFEKQSKTLHFRPTKWGEFLSQETTYLWVIVPKYHFTL